MMGRSFGSESKYSPSSYPKDGPPLFSLEAEKSVLGSMMMSPACIPDVDNEARPDEFYSETNGLLFSSLVQMSRRGATIDTVALRMELQTAGLLARIDRDDYLLTLTDTIPSPTSAVEHAKVIRLLASKRATQERILRAAALAQRGAVEEAARLLAGIDEPAARGARWRVMDAGELAESAIEHYAAPSQGRIHLGLPKLSQVVGYVPPGSLIVIGAPPGTGKSSMVLEMMLACAEHAAPQATGLISMEDPEVLTGGRLLMAKSGVSSRLMQRGIVENTGWDKANEALFAARKIGQLCLFANCTGGTEEDVRAVMADMARRGARVIAVDYITAVRCSRGDLDKRNQVNEILSGLKAYAKRLGVALIVVSQLKRPPPGYKTWEPSMRDLKETACLEEAAEVILLLWRDDLSDFAPVHVKAEKIKWGGGGQRWDMRRDKDNGSARLQEESYTPAPAQQGLKSVPSHLRLVTPAE